MEKFDDVFVSHSHRDERLVRKLVDTFQNWGIDVYVDFGDPALHQLMDRNLAEHLKMKIQRCRLLIFAFSGASASSRWMPWELGLAHGLVGRILLWPLDSKAEQALATQEYLSLYETIDLSNPRRHLGRMVYEARKSSVAPAHIAAMANLGEASAGNYDRFNDPAAVVEHIFYGPAQLYMAWLNAILGKR